MNMGKVRLGIVGIGSMGKNHLRVASEIPDVDLICVCDVDKKLVDVATKKFDWNGYSDYMEMVKKEELDAALVVVPTNHHLSVAGAYIDAGVNVLVEKPIAGTVEDGKKLIDAAKRKGVKLMVGHIERFNPAILELKRRLDAGQLGKVFKINARRIGPFPARIRDVGVVRDLAVHDLDIMRFLTGTDVTRVYAETAQRIHTNNEDLLSGLIRFNCGTLGVLSINWLTPTKVRELTITGEKGMFVANYITQELRFYENADLKDDYTYSEILRGVSEGCMTKYVVQKGEPLKKEIEHFISCVRDDKTPLVTGEDGLEAVKLAEALIESADSERCVKF